MESLRQGENYFNPCSYQLLEVPNIWSKILLEESPYATIQGYLFTIECHHSKYSVHTSGSEMVRGRDEQTIN